MSRLDDQRRIIEERFEAIERQHRPWVTRARNVGGDVPEESRGNGGGAGDVTAASGGNGGNGGNGGGSGSMDPVVESDWRVDEGGNAERVGW